MKRNDEKSIGKKSLIDGIDVKKIQNPHLKLFVERLKGQQDTEARFHYHKDGHMDYNDHPDSMDDYTCD